jgi:hypothetical protein
MDNGMTSEILQMLGISVLLLVSFAHLRTAFDIYGWSNKWGKASAKILTKKITLIPRRYYTYDIQYLVDDNTYTSSIGTQTYKRDVGGVIDIYFKRSNPSYSYPMDVFIKFFFVAIIFIVSIMTEIYLVVKIFTPYYRW